MITADPAQRARKGGAIEDTRLNAGFLQPSPERARRAGEGSQPIVDDRDTDARAGALGQRVG
ncbi:MAG: hypothetical protein ABSB58_07270, partial [Gemmatimonadales bacterium]